MTAPCPSGKIGHASRKAAKATAVAIGDARTHDAPRVYQCPDCRRWHLSSTVRAQVPAQPGHGRSKKPTGRRRPRLPHVATRAELDAWWAEHSKEEISSDDTARPAPGCSHFRDSDAR